MPIDSARSDSLTPRRAEASSLIPRSCAYAARTSASTGEFRPTVMKPASCRWVEASTASISAATSEGAQPCFVASPETFTSTNTGSVPVARASIFEARAGESSDSIVSTQASAWLILLD